MSRHFLGVDVGTSSSKAVLVDEHGQVVRSTVREHRVDHPAAGHHEMPAETWWEEFASMARELLADPVELVAVGVSGMGPCVLLADESDRPLRPAILYGVDTRATDQIDRLGRRLGEDAIVARCGSRLSTQAVGPKLCWLADHEPEVFARARRLYMPATWLVRGLTGAYVLDHHSASQAVPLYDIRDHDWYAPWVDLVAPGLELPTLVWPSDVVGHVSAEAAAATSVPAGTPVVAGTIDAWSEAASVGALTPGDLFLMYGTTMFLVHTLRELVTHPALWSTVGIAPGTRSLAGGMATSGAITSWLRDLAGSPAYADLLGEAAASGAGAGGLLMLPYFAGERTPIQDPHARGVLAGLTIEHTRGDLYRAALEATAFGVRHNLAALERAGARIERVVAAGGGLTGRLWPRIVSDVTGRTQHVNRLTTGASYGAAFLAATATDAVRIEAWNPVVDVIEPEPRLRERYDELFGLYLDLYPATREISHRLALHAPDPTPRSSP